eukprot:scaffold4752_cov113-Cylindrotheca_fusiformis.AAC.6
MSVQNYYYCTEFRNGKTRDLYVVRLINRKKSVREIKFFGGGVFRSPSKLRPPFIPVNPPFHFLLMPVMMVVAPQESLVPILLFRFTFRSFYHSEPVPVSFILVMEKHGIDPSRPWTRK